MAWGNRMIGVRMTPAHWQLLDQLAHELRIERVEVMRLGLEYLAHELGITAGGDKPIDGQISMYDGGRAIIVDD